MSNKKKIERFYLNEFFKILGETAEDVKAGEAPDFIVKLRHSKIGIEVTEFHSDLKGEQDRPRRAVEEAWTSLQRVIMEKIGKYKELEDTSGTLFFKKLELPPTPKYKDFVIELVQLSLEMIETNREEISPKSNYPLLNKYLDKFHLKKVGCYITWEWNHNASSIGLTESELVDTIQPKLVKAESYIKKNIDVLWLLVVSGSRLSQTMPVHLANKLLSFKNLDYLLSRSVFDKIYIYQYMVGVIYEWPNWAKIGIEQLHPTIQKEGQFAE
jgi:hypothetical protein